MSKSLVKGRPSKYKPEYAEKLLEFMATGASVMEAAAKLKISRDTLYRWAKEHTEFGDALQAGKEWSEAKNAEIIKAIALGQIQKASVPAYQMYMRNTAGWDKYAESGGVTQNISIGQMNLLQQKSVDELIEYIQDVSEDVKNIIDVDDFVDVTDKDVEKK
jgi:transposase-like protein